MTTIYVVQHGDKERLPGDPGLTEPGQRQAAVTAHWLQKMGLQALYSSPLRRARETAESLSRATGLAVQVDSRLRERLNWDGTQAFDAFLADWDRSTKDRDLILSNGESSRSAGERLRTFLAGLAGGSGPVAVVSHGGVTVDLLRNLLGDDRLPSHLVEDHIPPCAITTLDDLHVLGIAATSHLADWLLPATEIRRAPSGPNPRRQAQHAAVTKHQIRRDLQPGPPPAHSDTGLLKYLSMMRSKRQYWAHHDPLLVGQPHLVVIVMSQELAVSWRSSRVASRTACTRSASLTMNRIRSNSLSRRSRTGRRPAFELSRAPAAPSALTWRSATLAAPSSNRSIMTRTPSTTRAACSSISTLSTPGAAHAAPARTISLGTGLSCLADRRVAGQLPSPVVRECPSSTGLDRPIGHATGTIPGLASPAWKIGSGSRSSVLFIKRAGQLVGFSPERHCVSVRASCFWPIDGPASGRPLDANYRRDPDHGQTMQPDGYVGACPAQP